MINKKEFWLSVALAGVIACVIGYFVGNNIASKNNKQNVVANNPTRNIEKNNTREATSTNNSNTANVTVPAYVVEVFNYVITNKKAPNGFVGGRRFENRESQLPAGESYQEWDVKPKVQGQNRGAERLITNSKNDGYYTSDHYKTFTKLK